MTLATTSYPLHKPIPGGGSRRAGSVRLAITSRMEVLAGVPLFAGLPKRQLHAIALACRSRRWPTECCVVPENTKAQVCYVIVQGTVDVSTNGRTIAPARARRVLWRDRTARSRSAHRIRDNDDRDGCSGAVEAEFPGSRPGQSNHSVGDAGSSREAPPGDDREAHGLAAASGWASLLPVPARAQP